jgi:Transposase DDE domain
MPVLGSKAEDLDDMELYWNDRLTYPTGRFDPAWLRQAAAQDTSMPRGIPGGRQTPAVTENGAPLVPDANAFISLGPKPERMTGCSGCYDYTTTEGRINSIVIDPVTADHLVSSQQKHEVTLLGPVDPDNSWQAKAQQGYDVSTFVIDWEAHVATCPRGNTSSLWMPGRDHNEHAIVNIRFARNDCLAFPVRAQCVNSPAQPRQLTVRIQASHEALQAARQRQTSEAFKETYAKRAGIEGTISQAVRTSDLRRSRYIGFAKTHLHHLLTAAANNLQRASAWLAEVPRAATRVSTFAALAPSRA